MKPEYEKKLTGMGFKKGRKATGKSRGLRSGFLEWAGAINGKKIGK